MKKNCLQNLSETISYISLIVFAIFGAISTFGQSGAICLGLLGWLLAVFLQPRVKFSPNTMDIPVTIFIGVILLTTLISGINQNSLDGARKILGCIVFYLIGRQGWKTEKQIKQVFSILLFSCFLVALYGTIQYFTGINPFHSDKVQIFNRIQGTLSANSLGGIFGMILPVTFSLTLFYKNKLYLSYLIAMALALGFTFTRGAWIGTTVAIVFILLVYQKKMLIPFLTILLSLLFFWPAGRHRIQETFQLGKEVVRTNMWQVAIKMIKEKPLFGHGPQSFAKTFKTSPLGIDSGHSHCHNIYFGLTAETGIIGLLSFMTLVIYGIIVNINLLPGLVGWQKFLLLGITAGLIDFLIHGLVDYTIYGETGYLFGLFLAVTAYYQVNFNENKISQSH